MGRLRIISFFLALVLTIQMVPIAQIGYALSSNQWTEECPRNAIEDLAKSDSESNHFLLASIHYGLSDASSAADIYIHTSEQIPSNHSANVVTPPPDVTA